MDGKENAKGQSMCIGGIGVSKKKMRSAVITKVIIIATIHNHKHHNCNKAAVKAGTAVPLPCRHLHRVRARQTDSGEAK